MSNERFRLPAHDNRIHGGGLDDLPVMAAPPALSRGWFRTYRTTWRRASWTQPQCTEYGTFEHAEREARRAWIFDDSKTDGPVVEVRIESRIVSDWQVITQRRRDVDDGADVRNGAS